MLLGNRHFLVRGAAAVGLAWLSLIGLLVGLQALGYDFGFNVWWIGETRNWITFLQEGLGSNAARLFWQVDGRNPLSPWWYIPLRSFILNTSAAFFILHLVTSLLLGLASYLAIVEMTRGRGRVFATSVGITAAVFLCTRIIGSVHWNFVGALACSLLSVWSFAKFLNSARCNNVWLSLSLIFWLVAIQTYTIQSGAVLAVGLLSFTNSGPLRCRSDFIQRVLRAGADAVPFAGSLLLFILVWRTTTPAGITETAGAPDIKLAARSLLQGFWHSDYAVYATWIRQVGWDVVWIVVLIMMPLFVLTQAYVSGASESDVVPIRYPDLARVVSVGACLVAPTIALESSSTMFPPGTRWAMVLQFWTPLLTLSIAALVMLALPVADGSKRWLWWLATAAFATGAILLTLGANLIQTQLTRNERSFMRELRRIAAQDKAAGAEFPRHYIVKAKPGSWGPSDHVSRAYTKTELRGIGEVTFRYLTPWPVPYEPVFHSEHLENPEATRLGTTPYSRVSILNWNGKRLTRVKNFDSSSFEGLAGQWKRGQPLP